MCYTFNFKNLLDVIITSSCGNVSASLCIKCLPNGNGINRNKTIKNMQLEITPAASGL